VADRRKSGMKVFGPFGVFFEYPRRAARCSAW
jgi:hypothetical protein